MPKRYARLLELVSEAKPKSIVEIGVWKGLRAREMAEVALIYNDKVFYKGYDLFEEASSQTDEDELNAKRHWTKDRVARSLEIFRMNNPGFSFELFKGNTRETLPKNTVADFVYIDGGHSVDTIRSDYERTRNSPFIVFDDYYVADDEGRCPDLEKFGANKIVEDIPHEIINMGDPVRGGGLVCLAVVRQGGLGRAIPRNNYLGF